MTQSYYIGLDLGTTNLKGVITDSRMNPIADASVPAPMEADGQKREFPADLFVDRAAELIRRLTAAVPEAVPSIKAISTASASGNSVFLDRAGHPLCKALSWSDRRLCGKSAEYFPGFDLDSVYERAGWPYLEIFPLAHLAWLKKDRPDLFSQLGKVAMTTEYLQYAATGKWGIEPSAATTFYFQDQVKASYSADYLAWFGIDESLLPPILEERSVLGTILPEFAARTGLSAETKWVLGSFDHPACARALGALDEGNLLLSCGTSWAGLFVTKDRNAIVKTGMLADPYLRQEGNWAAIFAFTQFGEFIDARVAEYIDAASQKFAVFGDLTRDKIDPASAVYVPITDADACRAAWQGKSKKEIAESIIYSTSCDVRKKLDELDAQGFRADRIFMAGGPSQNSTWSATLSEQIGRPVVTPLRQFGGAVGAALMASIGDGLYKNERDFFGK